MILLLGETAEAREICSRLLAQGIPFLRLQTTEQGIRLIDSNEKCIIEGSFIGVKNWMPLACSRVFDASHPSFGNRFASLHQYCEQAGIPYIRLERPETKIPSSPLIHSAETWEEVLQALAERTEMLKSKFGRTVTIFVTTGSYQLESLTQSSLARYARLVVRVLPEARVIQKCRDLGIPARDIVAMQGPFSKELNRILFKFYNADILLTKDSGPAGGTDTKISAALNLGMEIVLFKKAKISGISVTSVEEMMAWVPC